MIAKGMGAYLIGQWIKNDAGNDHFDIYAGANSFKTARKRKQEIKHWPNATIIYNETGEKAFLDK